MLKSIFNLFYSHPIDTLAVEIKCKVIFSNTISSFFAPKQRLGVMNGSFEQQKLF
jgi:hypothetical protein